MSQQPFSTSRYDTESDAESTKNPGSNAEDTEDAGSVEGPGTDADTDPLDSLDETVHEANSVGGEQDADEGPVPPSPKATAKAPPSGSNRALIRRVAGKAAEVNGTDEHTVTVAAHLVSSSTWLAELTTAIMTAPRSALSAVHDLHTIADSDQMEAGVTAAAMGRGRIKALWSLLSALEATSTSSPPASDAKAAIALVRAVFALTEDDRAVLSDAQQLLKKG